MSPRGDIIKEFQQGRKQIQTRLPKLAGTVDADVSNLKQVEVAFAEAVRLMGGVDVLIKIDDTGAGPGHDAAPAETIAPNQLMMPQNLVVCELKGLAESSPQPVSTKSSSGLKRPALTLESSGWESFAATLCLKNPARL
jgi:NAD(P)-dependent dehydrogenase (short-subunit alcohol dehydrogenase family)